MRLTWRDGAAAVLVGSAAVFYALWATGTAGAGLSTRAAAGVVFALGWVACMSDRAGLAEAYGVDTPRRPSIGYAVAVSALGALALTAGIVALVAASEAMLVTLVAAMAALWLLSTARHAIVPRAGAGDRGSPHPTGGTV